MVGGSFITLQLTVQTCVCARGSPGCSAAGTDTCIHIFTWTDTGTHKYVLPGQVRIHTHISAHTLKAVDSVMGGATYIVIQWVS